MHKYCFTCKYENLSAESEPCEGCFDGSASKLFPKTQADRIRAMSDEELTEFLKHWNWDNYIVMGKSVVNDWLKQEVE